MSTPDTTAPSPTTLPRWLAALIMGAIALASLVALVWPLLPTGGPTAPAGKVGVITGQLGGQGMRGGIGANAPDFAYLTSDGATKRLSDYRGKVVVLNFWATRCRPCLQELPAMNRVAASEPDVVFLAVASTGLLDTSAKVDSFFSQLSLDHITPVLDDGITTLNRYGVLDLPTTFFVDKDGVIRHFQIGLLPLNEDQFKRGIAKASLGGTAFPPPPSAPDLGWLALALPVAAGGVLLFGFLRSKRKVSTAP